MSELQPLETAPRDGSKFLGEVGEDLISMFWHPEFEAFISSFRRHQLYRGMTFADTGLDYEDHSPVVHKPTRWTPALSKATAPKED